MYMEPGTYSFKVAHTFCLCREEAARMWRKREAEWEREVKAREKLMAEVPAT